MAPLGDVAHGGAFLSTIREQGGRVGIHGGTVAEAEPREEVGPELVVGRLQVLEVLGSEAPEEGPQGIAVREVGQPQERRQETIVYERLGISIRPIPARLAKRCARKRSAGW